MMQGRLDIRGSVLVSLLMFAAFNANGREIATYDSQPTKFAARELLLRGTLSLNHVVGSTPQLIERPGFQLANDGRYRSAYSPVPAIAAAVIVWPLWVTGIVDVRAPLAPALISAVASSALVAAAVAMAFLIARLELTRVRALAVAAALGLGTGLWSTASQTLWQHETAVLGLAMAVLAFTLVDPRRTAALDGCAPDRRRAGLAVFAGLGLGLAAGSRLQLAPAVAVLLAGIAVRAGWRHALTALLCASAIVVPVCLANMRWFGSPLGAAPMLEALHETVHRTAGSFSIRSGGFSGLLLSPNRGLFIFSPVVLVALAGVGSLVRADRRSPLIWCTLAASVQYLLYAAYVVWWGGHTYGPRYMLDVLPLLIPLGIAGAREIRGRIAPALAEAALAWSIAVTAIGAFNHPAGRWNNEPADVDRHHERLWDWRDNQIVRTWQAGPSQQNFSLLARDAFRRPPS